MERKPRIGITSGIAEEPSDAVYRAAIEGAGGEIVFLRPGMDNPPMDELDGLLLSGGVDVEPRLYGEEINGTEEIDYDRDRLEFAAIDAARARKMPILGICRGFQVLNVAYGGKLVQHMEGHRAYTVPGLPKKVSILHPIRIDKPDSRLARALGTSGEVPTNSRHHQAVREPELAPGMIATATSHDGYIEAIEARGDEWVVGVQSHPERAFEVDSRFHGLFRTFVRQAAGGTGMDAAHDAVRVELGERSYDIVIGSDLLRETAARIAPLLRSKNVFVAWDEHVAQPHGGLLVKSLSEAGFHVELLQLPAGESTKSLTHLESIWDALSARRFGRDCAVVALGGGVIGDLVGFAAATYLRGVDFIQVPTSLLAMVDSSVGGKTGINNRHGKNLLGSFWQPRLVLIDTATLETLPREECVAALGEVIKYGVIYDADFFAWLEKEIEGVRDRVEGPLVHAVRRSCEIKAAVVGADERESGLREILNFGHTIGHAIENVAGYGTLRHGEAVAIGMVAESMVAFGQKTGWTEADHARLVRLVERAGLPARLPAGQTVRVEDLLETAKSDKKARAGKVRYVLPLAIGRVESVKLENEAVVDALRAIGAV